MDKYSGMNKVESVVTANSSVVKKRTRERSFFKTFLMQCVAVTLIGCALFVCGLVGGKLNKVPKTVKTAVCFDTGEYIAELIEDKKDKA